VAALQVQARLMACHGEPVEHVGVVALTLLTLQGTHSPPQSAQVVAANKAPAKRTAARKVSVCPMRGVDERVAR
jgi:hypothetical protein